MGLKSYIRYRLSDDEKQTQNLTILRSSQAIYFGKKEIWKEKKFQGHLNSQQSP